VIELSSAELAVTLDPSHGAEILQLWQRSSGRQLLGHPPGEPGPSLAGDLDEQTWTSRYRGGWQLAVPNAGNACRLGGERHGFHGRGSVDPWDVLERERDRAVVRWVGHGLELTRSVTVVGGSVAVELSWTATDAPTPLIAVEHVCFGRELLDPEVEVLAEARAHEMSEQDGPVQTPPDAMPWPHSRLLSGEIENAASWPLSQTRARFTSLTGFKRGRAAVRNARTGLGVRIDWEHTKLPGAWLWHEVRATPGIWDQKAELMGFEPASVPHSLGLAEAVARGQAIWAAPGERDGYWMQISLLGP
jgi:Domain of unknown function (DUF4432)